MPALVPLKPPQFHDMMEIEKIRSVDGRDIYMSKNPAMTLDYAPGQPLSKMRAYGGHIYAQAMWVASSGIGSLGFKIHEVNGYWTQAGMANRPFVFEVITLSQTRSFVLRQINARQPKEPSEECPFPTADASKPLGDIAFTCTCSFKRGEPTGQEYWLKLNLEKYGRTLTKDPATLPIITKVPGLGGLPKVQLPLFGGIDVRTPDLDDFNASVPGTERRRLHLYRIPDPMDHFDSNLHAAAHAYNSDRAGLTVLATAFGSDHIWMAGSLNHKIIYHSDPDDLIMKDGQWFIQEMFSNRGGQGRGLIESHIWSPTGVLLASTVQDAMFRQPEKSKLS